MLSPTASNAPGWNETHPAAWNVPVGRAGRRDLSGTLVVGRNPSVDPAHRGAELMPIADRQKSVSKTHAALTATPQGLLVEDLRSTNGTVVISADGNPVPVAPGFPIWATDGASVLFGGRRVKVVIR